MSCCKEKLDSPKNDGGGNILGGILFFIVGFVVITVLLPFIWLAGIYFLFNSAILNKSSTILPSMTFFYNLLNKNKEVDEDEEVDEYNVDDYELMDYQIIEDDE
jgi:ABC-type glycerol-3-phosphate transport system permease component